MYVESEFLKYGCLSRCLIHLQGKIKWEEFCNEYESLFHDEYYGMIKSEFLVRVITELGFWIRGSTGDYQSIKNCFESGDSVVVISRVDLSPDSTEIINHASVLKSITNQDFTLWTPCQSGWEGEIDPLERKDWDQKVCSAILLRADDPHSPTVQ